MADTTCMNELEVAIQRFNATMKKFMEDEDVRHAEYMMSRVTDALRMDRVEEKLVALQVSSASNGGSDSFLQSCENHSFPMLTRMTDESQEEIESPELFDVEVSTLALSFSDQSQITTTPYTTGGMTVPEVLRETFLVVNASDSSSDRVIEPSISIFYGAPIIKGFIPSIVKHDCNSKRKTTTDVDNKRLGSSPVIVLGDFNIVSALTLPRILLSDPPELVSIPPPPLAPPWLHGSVYPRPLDFPPLSKVNNLPHYFQFKQKILVGTQSHNTLRIDHQICGVFVLTCSSYAYTNIVSSCETYYLFVKMPLIVYFSCDTFTSLKSMMKIHACLEQADEDTSKYSASSILFNYYQDCSNSSPSSGLELKFGLIAIVGSSSFPYDLYVHYACHSRGMILNRNMSFHDLVNLFYCFHIELLLVLSLAHDQTKLKGWNLLSFLVVERIGQVKLLELLSFHHFAMFNMVVVYNLNINEILDCKVMPLQHSFDDSSGNHNAYLSYKHMDLDISRNTKLSFLSFLSVYPYGYIDSPYGYMSTLSCYSVALIEVWIAKQTMERLVSLTIGCYKSIMQYQQVPFFACVLTSVLTGVCLFTTQQMGLSEKAVHEAYTLMDLIVDAINKWEYLVYATYLVTCVSFIGLEAGNCWMLIPLEILVHIMMVWESLLTNQVQLSALVEIFMFMRCRHVNHKNILPVDDYDVQSIANLIRNGWNFSLMELEDILQQLQTLVPKPYHVHSLSYMHDLSHDGAIDVAGLISFSAAKYVVAATEGLLLAITLSLVFYMKKIKQDKTPIAKAFTCGEIKELNNSTIMYTFSYDMLETLICHTGGELLKIKCGPIVIMGSPTETALLAYTLYIGSDFCIFNGFMWLVLILQVATTMSKFINAQEPYSNVVLEKYIQENIHIYFENFESNPLDVVIWLSGCFVNKKASSQFSRWDPGGCSIDLEAIWVDTTIFQYCLSFNLEDKVDFNGEVML